MRRFLLCLIKKKIKLLFAKLQVIEQIVSCQYDNISKNRDFLDELWKIFIIFL